MTRNEVTDVVKDLIGRNWTGIDATIYNTLNSVIELYGSSISAIYDEESWKHIFTTTDVSQEINAYELPTGTKYILNATVIDPTGEEATYYKVHIVSPKDSFDIDSLDRSGRPGFYTNSRDISGTQIMTFNTFTGGGTSQVSRVDRSGIPRFVWRFGNNAYIYPRSSTAEVNWELRILVAKKPPTLTTNTTNTITINYPFALAHFAAGILWGTRLGDDTRANQQYLLASQHLSAIATDQEISKLININLRRA